MYNAQSNIYYLNTSLIHGSRVSDSIFHELSVQTTIEILLAFTRSINQLQVF